MSDGVHDVLTDYAVKVAFGDMNPEVVDGATARILDTFGALVAGFGGEPCRMLRQMATELLSPTRCCDRRNPPLDIGRDGRVRQRDHGAIRGTQ